MSDRYKILFVVFVSLGIYYPSLFDEITSVDDSQMISALINMDKIPWKELFLPSSPPVYYRPVLMLSFYLDRFAFGCSEFFMHFDNIILHTLNGVFVFLLVRSLLRKFDYSYSPYAPMFAALLFILHPINTEPVNFISGRTDVLAATFVLLSFLIFLEKGLSSFYWRCGAALLFLLGLFSKEVAIALLPTLGIFMILRGNPQKTVAAKGKLIYLLPFVCVTVIYLLLRRLPSLPAAPGVAGSPSPSSIPLVFVGTLFKAIGFYVKKLFLPVPLNFGIVEIHSTFYSWCGIAVTVLFIYFFLKKRILPFFFFSLALLFILPAIPLAIRRIAWTPLAERYLYMSSVGISALIAISIDSMRWKREISFGLLAVLLTVAGIVTVNRNITWQSNLTLFEDTVRKSPGFAGARNDYGLALLQKQRTAEAIKQFSIAERLAGSSKYAERPSINITVASASEKKPEEIKNYFKQLLDRNLSPESARIVLHDVIRTAESQIKTEGDPTKKKTLYREIISYNERLFKLDNDGFYLYRIGQLYLTLGEKKKSLEYFKRSVELSPQEYFSETARKLINRLGHEQNQELHQPS